MSWVLTTDIINKMPNWRISNLKHLIARHLLTLASPPTDESTTYSWLEQQITLVQQHDITQSEHIVTAIEAMYLASAPLDDPELIAILTSPALACIRVKRLLKWAHQCLESAEAEENEL